MPLSLHPGRAHVLPIYVHVEMICPSTVGFRATTLMHTRSLSPPRPTPSPARTGPAAWIPQLPKTMKTVKTGCENYTRINENCENRRNLARRKKSTLFFFLNFYGFHGFRLSVCSFRIWFSTVFVNPCVVFAWPRAWRVRPIGHVCKASVHMATWSDA